ncbi:MAG: resolvase [Labilithrix sp.]|jgi:DNA invertase Pin-like site-specific DNA recombinase|nr:resolvase [Labilithrix sp.]
MNAVLYLRVSTTAQAVDGFGLDVQEQACSAYAKHYGLRIVAVFRDEGVPGTLAAADRDGLMSALTRLQDGDADVLLVARLDRLARSLTVQEAVLAQVWKMHRAMHSADIGPILHDDPDDPMRTAMRQMAGVFAQLDRGMLTKRLRDGRKAKAAKGGRAVGPAPFGYRAHDGMLHPIPTEQRALRRMHKLRSKGMTCQQIADALAAEGHPTKRGGRWTSPVVSRILSRSPVPAEQIAAPTTTTTKEPA